MGITLLRRVISFFLMTEQKDYINKLQKDLKEYDIKLKELKDKLKKHNAGY